jgi:hypothetical protein
VQQKEKKRFFFFKCGFRWTQKKTRTTSQHIILINQIIEANNVCTEKKIKTNEVQTLNDGRVVFQEKLVEILGDEA